MTEKGHILFSEEQKYICFTMQGEQQLLAPHNKTYTCFMSFPGKMLISVTLEFNNSKCVFPID